MINLTINEKGRANNIQRAREHNIIIPTIAQMQDPDKIPEKIKKKLKKSCATRKGYVYARLSPPLAMAHAFLRKCGK